MEEVKDVEKFTDQGNRGKVWTEKQWEALKEAQNMEVEYGRRKMMRNLLNNCPWVVVNVNGSLKFLSYTVKKELMPT